MAEKLKGKTKGTQKRGVWESKIQLYHSTHSAKTKGTQ
jgi:hypothetical protein